MAKEHLTADFRTYSGLFFVTLATLVYEILLTRVFSVTMWYHYAFMAVSLALFGMTVGAILVPMQLDGSESVQTAIGAARPSVAPRKVSADATPSNQMHGII